MEKLIRIEFDYYASFGSNDENDLIYLPLKENLERGNFRSFEHLQSSAGIGPMNLISTLLGISMIDHFGRRTLMKVGTVGLILTLILVSQALFSQQMSLNVPFYLFAYISFFGFSQ